MTQFETLTEVWRGSFLESRHQGAVCIANAQGEIIDGMGDAAQIILPRSSYKMLQALPLIESGAADRAGLTPAQLALACASHQGAPMHVGAVEQWLGALGMSESDLRCGQQPSSDKAYREEMIREGQMPDQRHNNCSGKHTGFLTLAKHLGAGAEYIDLDHPVQIASRDAIEAMAGESNKGFVIDGCSAPNYAISLRGLATAMARMADPSGLGAARQGAANRLIESIAAHPLMLAGEGRACSELIAAMENGSVVKTGAEGVFTAILPRQGLGVALKIADGTTRAANTAIAAVLVRLGAADPAHPVIAKWLEPQITNRNGYVTGVIRPAVALEHKRS